MAVAYATTSSTLGSFGQNVSVTLPSGSAAGDLIALITGHEPAYSVSSFSNITGWIEAASVASLSNWRQRVWYKVLTSGDVTAGSATVNLSAAGSYSDMIMHRITGVDGSAPLPASGGATVNTGTSTTPSGTSCTVDRSGSLLMRFEVNASGTGRNAAPSGMSATTGSPLDTNNWADYEVVSPSSTGNKDSGLSASDNWAVHMVVFQPASSGTTYDVTPSDTISVTDDLAIVASYVRESNDTASLTDTATGGRITDVDVPLRKITVVF